jgi:hypothetical protein
MTSLITVGLLLYAGFIVLVCRAFAAVEDENGL